MIMKAKNMDGNDNTNRDGNNRNVEDCEDSGGGDVTNVNKDDDDDDKKDADGNGKKMWVITVRMRLVMLIMWLVMKDKNVDKNDNINWMTIIKMWMIKMLRKRMIMMTRKWIITIEYG